MVPNRCVVCSSERIIPGVTIWDQGRQSSGELKVAIAANPDAIVFREVTFSRVRAAICGDCGHVELSVDDPRALYDAYLRNIGATQG
jgi:hypothetical protein